MENVYSTLIDVILVINLCLLSFRTNLPVLPTIIIKQLNMLIKYFFCYLLCK